MEISGKEKLTKNIYDHSIFFKIQIKFQRKV